MCLLKVQQRRGCSPRALLWFHVFREGRMASDLFANKSNLCCSNLAECFPEQRFPLEKQRCRVLITAVRPRRLIMGLAASFSHPSSNIAGRWLKNRAPFSGAPKCAIRLFGGQEGNLYDLLAYLLPTLGSLSVRLFRVSGLILTKAVC